MLVTTPISVGELLDKLSIIRIKLAKITDPAKLKNIKVEYDLLEHAKKHAIRSVQDYHGLDALNGRLQAVNEKLWEVEDEIRDKERLQTFDARFIELARMVYHHNDQRSRIKRLINDLFCSTIVEEKSYKPY